MFVKVRFNVICHKMHQVSSLFQITTIVYRDKTWTTFFYPNIWNIIVDQKPHSAFQIFHNLSFDNHKSVPIRIEEKICLQFKAFNYPALITKRTNNLLIASSLLICRCRKVPATYYKAYDWYIVFFFIPVCWRLVLDSN